MIEFMVEATAILMIEWTLRPVLHRIETRRATARGSPTIYWLKVECDAQDHMLLRTILLRHIGSHASLKLQGMTSDHLGENKVAILAEILATQREDRAIEEVIARVTIEPSVRAIRAEGSVPANAVQGTSAAGAAGAATPGTAQAGPAPAVPVAAGTHAHPSGACPG